MKKTIVVREYARLTTEALTQNSLDQAQISETAFDWLCELAAGFRSSGAQLLQVGGRQWLKLDNYVGILESPCGQVIEVLPKIHEYDDCVEKSRALLGKLIASALQLPVRQADVASLKLYKMSLAEWVMRQFLVALEHLLKRGLRFEYQRVEEEQSFLRGQLNVVQQMRQPPGRQHLFQIRHDIFLPDRPENRLLKSALRLVCKSAQEPENWRLAHELFGMLQQIPDSKNIQQDFRLWRNERLLAHYQPVKPWCELILHQQMPLATVGGYRGISMLFPMERLFESYVAVELRKAVQALGASGNKLNSQLKTRFLCKHQNGDIFQLKPDLELQLGVKRWILDTKWKRLDANNRSNKYGLSQTDFYQMFAYGHTYLGGQGTLVLIYPAWEQFPPLTPPLQFSFDSRLELLALPFDLEDKDAAKSLIRLLNKDDGMAPDSVVKI